MCRHEDEDEHEETENLPILSILPLSLFQNSFPFSSYDFLKIGVSSTSSGFQFLHVHVHVHLHVHVGTFSSPDFSLPKHCSISFK